VDVGLGFDQRRREKERGRNEGRKICARLKCSTHPVERLEPWTSDEAGAEVVEE
jgi:hypothetical protein